MEIIGDANLDELDAFGAAMAYDEEDDAAGVLLGNNNEPD
jgi:hypothetical protein